jgi:hypothetical protein
MFVLLYFINSIDYTNTLTCHSECMNDYHNWIKDVHLTQELKCWCVTICCIFLNENNFKTHRYSSVRQHCVQHCPNSENEGAALNTDCKIG